MQAKIKKGTFQHVESELYAYHDTKKEIMRIKNDILHASPEPDLNGGGRSNLPSDPTGRTATLMVTHRKVEQMQLIIDAIDTVYEMLPDEKKRLIDIKYWTRPQLLTWDGIAKKLHVSRRTAINWRNEIIHAIANIIGWR